MNGSQLCADTGFGAATSASAINIRGTARTAAVRHRNSLKKLLDEKKLVNEKNLLNVDNFLTPRFAWSASMKFDAVPREPVSVPSIKIRRKMFKNKNQAVNNS